MKFNVTQGTSYPFRKVGPLSDEALAIAGVLIQLGTKWCYPTYSHFQRCTGFSFTQIFAAIRELETEGAVEIVRDASPQGTDLYRLIGLPNTGSVYIH